MSESVRVSEKKSEAAQKDRTSQTRKSDYSQPVNSSVDYILFLQRTIGNQAVGRLIKSGALQAKLRIGQPGDIYEQEADRVAYQVMMMSEPEKMSGNHYHIRRACPKCEENELQRQPIKEEEEEKIHRQPAEDEGEKLQAKEATDFNHEIDPYIENHIKSMKGGGSPLSEGERAFFEPRFGADFSQVRVHAGIESAELNQQVQAKAFTQGSNIHFGDGQYDPGSMAGKELLAHELTHTIQQGAAGTSDPAVQWKDLSEINSGLVQRDPNDPNQSIDQEYATALQMGDWQAAAEWLNGYNRDDILSRLAKLIPQQIANIHQGALDNPRVGPQSQVAQLTTPNTTLWDPKLSNFQNQLANNPAAAHAYKPIYGVTGRLIGYSRSSGGYSEVRNTDGEIIWSDEIPLEHGLPIIDPALDLIEKGLQQMGYVVVGTLDTVLENNWRALGLPVDENHTQPIAKRLGIPPDATAYTIGRGAGHAVSLLQTAGEIVGGVTLFISGAGEFMAGVATTPEGIGVVIAPVGVITMAGGAAVVIHGGALGKATFMNMTMKGDGEGRRAYEPPVRDHEGKVGGELPKSGAETKRALESWTREEMEDAAKELEESIAARQAEQIQKGETSVGPQGQPKGASHRVRIAQEYDLLRAILKKLSGT